MYKRYWMVKLTRNGFEALMMLYGTEEEIWAYMESEFGHNLGYHGAGEKEVEMARRLGMKAYICPEVKR